MNLTLLGGVLVGLMALCAFSLDIMTSPKAVRWMALPGLIRWQIRLTGSSSLAALSRPAKLSET